MTNLTKADESMSDAAASPPEGELRLRHVVVHGYRRAFRMAGSGPVLLFIHGIGDSSATWLDVLPRLAEHFTVIAPDLLGHGGSDKPSADYSVAGYACGMRDLLTVLDIDHATVIGHSLGGGVAIQFAYQFPERCERLVLVGSGGIGRYVHPLLRLACLPGADLVISLATAAPVLMATSLLTPLMRCIGGLGLGSDLHYALERFRSLADNTSRLAFLRTLRSAVDWRGQTVTMLDRSYLLLGTPTLLVWGDRDRVVSTDHADLAHVAMPHSRLEIFRGAGHFPHQADPERFVALLSDFHAGTAAAKFDHNLWRTMLCAGHFDVPQREHVAPEVLEAVHRAAHPSGA
ncbi:pimeloyl-ACP methyl ester carboxylesterase [Lentzea nigeriaca]|nr:alpha/beta hydrolase [Lentzea nigeriaca]MBM7857198.1 pimeloyl-ACP methyl ester carboxylesterase [Lentzea nigeriaca]